MKKPVIIIVILVVVACILVAAALGVGLWIYQNYVSNSPSQQAVTSTPVLPAPTGWQPTFTPILPTFTPVQPTFTPVQPTPKLTQTPLQPAQRIFSFEGLSFVLDPINATGANAQVIPENPGTAEGPYWEAAPEYLSVELTGYQPADMFHKPVITVYPVDDFSRLNPTAAETITNLKALLAEKPAAPSRIPTLPVWNAGQVFRSNVRYLDFQNGSGVRFLAIYAQYVAPVNNYDLFYTFQGFTADGRYVISVILPVNHPSLRGSPNDFSQAEMEQMINDAENYYSVMAADLESRPDNSFLPSLAALDTLVQSIQINR
ncbi:MAG TPA: hypothetical protein VIO36_10180 [Anaerolineaceae bacterium]